MIFNSFTYMIRFFSNVHIAIFVTLSLNFIDIYATGGSFSVSGYERGAVPSNVYRPSKPLMWTARLKVDRAIIAAYEKRIYKPWNYLEFYSGLSVGYLEKNQAHQDSISVISNYIMMRVYLMKTSFCGLFLLYSPAGPSFLSKKNFVKTGFSNRFVFQDQFGLGAEVKGRAHYEIFAKLYHFSNGDIFPINGGIDIPLMVGLAIKL